MGDRAAVELIYHNYSNDDEIDGKVYLYTHWGGSELPDVVSAALKRGRERWSDPSYLARIIFSEMIRYDVLTETGYGIDVSPQSDIEHPLLEIHLMHRAGGYVKIGSDMWSFAKFTEPEDQGEE